MQLTVTYACGHSVKEVRYGGRYEEQLERAKKMLCPDCYRKQMQAEALDGIKVASLEGSEKQIKWAEDIRARIIGEARKFFEANATTPEAEALANDIITTLANQTSAKWWIDRRDKTQRDLLLEVRDMVRG